MTCQVLPRGDIMLIFRFLLLLKFFYLIGSHTFIFKKYIIFLICCIAAAPLYTV